MKNLLEQFNLKVDTCSDGQSAVLKVVERDPENMYRLILMDYSMPICDGPQTVQLINEHLTRLDCPFSMRPRICFITAFTEKSYMEVAKQTGRHYFLVKPIFKARL